MGVNLLLRLCGNRRKPVILFGLLVALTGSVLFYLAPGSSRCALLLSTAYAMIAFPAGFFPLFGTVGKELNPPEHTALAVAMVNFWCFVAIAVFQNVNGWILQHFSSPGSTVYPPEAYTHLAVFLGAMTVFGIILSFFYPETGGSPSKR